MERNQVFLWDDGTRNKIIEESDTHVAYSQTTLIKFTTILCQKLSYEQQRIGVLAFSLHPQGWWKHSSLVTVSLNVKLRVNIVV